MQDHDQDDYEGVSKSQIKRDLLELQALGLRLCDFNRKQLAALTLPEKLLDAMADYRKVGHGPAMKRQRQYIGKLLREVDTTPIRAFLAVKAGESDAYNVWLHTLEHWRNRLLSNPDALTLLLQEYPQADAQQLRTLIRNAQKEKQENKPPKNYRALFQALKELSPEPSFSQPVNDIEGEDDDE